MLPSQHSKVLDFEGIFHVHLIVGLLVELFIGLEDIQVAQKDGRLGIQEGAGMEVHELLLCHFVQGLVLMVSDVLVIDLQQHPQQYFDLLLGGVSVLLVVESLVGHGLIDLDDLLPVPEDLFHAVFDQPVS